MAKPNRRQQKKRAKSLSKPPAVAINTLPKFIFGDFAHNQKVTNLIIRAELNNLAAADDSISNLTQEQADQIPDDPLAMMLQLMAGAFAAKNAGAVTAIFTQVRKHIIPEVKAIEKQPEKETLDALDQTIAEVRQAGGDLQPQHDDGYRQARLAELIEEAESMGAQYTVADFMKASKAAAEQAQEEKKLIEISTDNPH